MIKRLSFFIALSWTSICLSQTDNTSPYSYFGIGDTNQQMSVASSSMGSINISLNYLNELNFTNPAAQSTLKYTTFSFTGRLKLLQVDDGTNTQSASYASLSSLALGFPISKKAGFMVGLQPNSNVGYSIDEEFYSADNELTELNSFDGNGGTNRFFGSFGYQIAKGLSLGVEGAYLFGTINNNIINKRLGVSFDTKHQLISKITGATIKFGTQYTKDLKNDLSINVGASVKLKNNLKANSDEYFYSFLSTSSGEYAKDTIVSNIDVAGEVTRPLSLTVGTSFGKPDNWFIGLEFESQDALEFDQTVFQNNSKAQYSEKTRYSIGGYWIPKRNSITSYWQRVIYRGGIKYENTGLAMNTLGNSGDFTPINDFGISFGMGLPIGNQLSQVNLGVEYGKRGSITAGLIKENYFNLRLDLNLTDKWFRKRKIN